ncbi:MAG: hypothetical protein HDQ87_03695 [Clostridia bacterium]|nr:hypothetical protein [Clostridia bacterium]
MLVEIIENRISIPAELLEALEVEDGQQLHLSVQDGVLHACPPHKAAAKPAAQRTPDQDMAHFIADSFTKLEEMVALMAAVCDVKGRVKNADPKRTQEIAKQLEEIVLRAREEESGT